jgi:hypothetical protein
VFDFIRGAFKWWQRRRRFQLAREKWATDIGYILEQASAEDHGDFMWGQVVMQEIHMYISLGEQVQPQEFNWLCLRRGFSPEMRGYLTDMLVHVGLGSLLGETRSEPPQGE